MKKKYKFTGETKELITEYNEKITLHRIMALKKITIETFDMSITIEPGTLGGWIEEEINLSHKGNCWVGTGSIVYKYSIIEDNSYVESSIIRNSRLRGNSRAMCGSVIMKSILYDAVIYESILTDCTIHGSIEFQNQSDIRNIERYFPLINESHRFIIKNASINDRDDILYISGIGSRHGTTLVYYDNQKKDIMVICGCFTGSLVTFIDKVIDRHSGTKFEIEYLQFVKMVFSHFTSRIKDNPNYQAKREFLDFHLEKVLNNFS